MAINCVGLSRKVFVELGLARLWYVMKTYSNTHCWHAMPDHHLHRCSNRLLVALIMVLGKKRKSELHLFEVFTGAKDMSDYRSS